MFKKLLIIGIFSTFMLGQLSFADTKSKKVESSFDDILYFQIHSFTEKKKTFTFTGYWIVPEQVVVHSKSKKKPPIKIRPPRKVVYILPGCKSQLEKFMDSTFGGGRTDICSRLIKGLDDMQIPYVGHSDFNGYTK